jgi:hypothetical protein
MYDPVAVSCQEFLYHCANNRRQDNISDLANCDAELFFEGHGRRFNPVGLFFAGPCWSSCARDFGRRWSVRVGGCGPRGRAERQGRGTEVGPRPDPPSPLHP